LHECPGVGRRHKKKLAFLTWFSLKKQENKQLKLWDCDVCHAQGYREQRACFLENSELPVTYKCGRETNEGIINVDELWDIVDTLQDANPGAPIYALVGLIRGTEGGCLRELCPVSIVDPFIDTLITMEALCEVYHALPLSGGLLDQPSYLMESFSTIRATRNFYDEEKARKLNGKNNTKKA